MDTKENATKMFLEVYGKDYEVCDAIPDPNVPNVWMVVGKKETKRTIKIICSILYLKLAGNLLMSVRDAEEVPIADVLRKYPYIFKSTRTLIETTKKKVIDLAA